MHVIVVVVVPVNVVVVVVADAAVRVVEVRERGQVCDQRHSGGWQWSRE